MGFGQEIKDFLGAATVTYKALGSREDREYKKARSAYMRAKGDLAADPAMRDLAKRKLEAQIQKLNAGPQMHPMQQRLLQQKIDYYKASMPEKGAVPAGPAESARPMVGPQGAIEPTVDTASYDAGDEGYSDTGYEDTLYSASGGMVTSRGKKPKALKVKGYADGGSVEDDDVQDSYDDADNASAENSVADDVDYDANSEPDSDEDDIGAVSAVNASKPKIDYALARDAAVAGVRYSQAHHQAAESGGAEGAGAADQGEGAVPVTTEVSAASRKPAVPGGRGGARGHLSGEGAASASEMAAIEQKIDKDHTLSEAERKMAALSHVYEWTLINKGPEAADRVAGSMTQFMRMQSDRHKALAQVAAGEGDVNGTVKEIARAYANVPDGRNLKFSNDNGKIKATFTDQETGKEVEKFIVTPDQMLQWATKGGIQSFDALLQRSALGRQELKDRDAAAEKTDTKQYTRGRDAKADDLKERQLAVAKDTAAAKKLDAETKANAPMKPSDRKIVRAEVDEAAEADPKVKEVEGPYFPEIVSSAKSIAEQNAKLDGLTSVRVAREMTTIDPSDPTKFTWQRKADDKGNLTVTLDNGTIAHIPADTVARLAKVRIERVKVAQDAIAKAKARSESAQSTSAAVKGAVGSLYGNPAPARSIPVLGQPGFGQSTPLDEAPPGSVPRRGLGEM